MKDSFVTWNCLGREEIKYRNHNVKQDRKNYKQCLVCEALLTDRAFAF